ncbi:hypothetical protein NDU88_001246 [Pleurodeles waltl]|uniref:Uncharacterized protein n=1 Tax=Pleurodeles waltl TaxID=8319 RepID=A0AAV7SC26_PLEWA|nr:hypothetical protein NDU88_001246 [Pleurodeles waltl]
MVWPGRGRVGRGSACVGLGWRAARHGVRVLPRAGVQALPRKGRSHPRRQNGVVSLFEITTETRCGHCDRVPILGPQWKYPRGTSQFTRIIQEEAGPQESGGRQEESVIEGVKNPVHGIQQTRRAEGRHRRLKNHEVKPYFWTPTDRRHRTKGRMATRRNAARTEGEDAQRPATFIRGEQGSRVVVLKREAGGGKVNHGHRAQ